MPRVLSMHRTIVTPVDRKKYLTRLQAKKEYYARANCRFWVFEETGLSGAFLEFFEAPDVATLTAAHAGAADRVVDPARIYQEVELK